MPEIAETTAPCDLIMRGGIASGIVYPGVIARLAQDYHFKCIGGASAGAIAAVAAAAAEFGRTSATGGFPVIGGLPDEIGGAAGGVTGFRQLFQPVTALRSEMAVLWAVLGQKRGVSRGVAITAAVAGRFVTALLVTGTLVAGADWLLHGPLVGWQAVVRAGLLLALTVIIALLATLLGLVLPLDAKLRRNGFGLAGGANPALTATASIDDLKTEGYLSDWLHSVVQRAAGIPDGAPLTMGDLWGNTDPWQRDRAIDLVLTTTNLTYQLPHQFPFLERGGMKLWFKPEELSRVLPKAVVAQMVAKSPSSDRHAGYLRLPPPHDLPVLFGARLSLSFPLLLSGVILHVGEDDQQLTPCVFSDGGITSNFPITAFDAALPRWPTFCVNLVDVPGIAQLPGAARIHLPTDNQDGQKPVRQADVAAGGVAGFIGAIVDTARNAQENELMLVGGQRDRIVSIRLDPASEGGLNLDMPAATIKALQGYGVAAAAALVQQFPPTQQATIAAEAGDAIPAGAGWANHRWIRLRTLLAGLENLMVGVARANNGPMRGDIAYRELLRQSKPKAMPSYNWANAESFDRALPVGEQVFEIADLVADTVTDRPADSIFDGIRRNRTGSLGRVFGAPRPRLGLRMRPLGSRDPTRG